jgi:hypothetical protein
MPKEHVENLLAVLKLIYTHSISSIFTKGHGTKDQRDSSRHVVLTEGLGFGLELRVATGRWIK